MLMQYLVFFFSFPTITAAGISAPATELITGPSAFIRCFQETQPWKARTENSSAAFAGWNSLAFGGFDKGPQKCTLK